MTRHFLMIAATVFTALAVGRVHAFEPRWNPFGSSLQKQPQQGAASVQPDAVPGGPAVSAARTLRAVLLSDEQSYANIDGQLLRVGQTLDGWRLSEVGPHHATLTRSGARHVLQLRAAPADKASQTAKPTSAETPNLAGLPDTKQAPAEAGSNPTAVKLLDKVKELLR